MKEYISHIKNMKPKAIELSSVVFGRFVLEKLNKLFLIWLQYFGQHILFDLLRGLNQIFLDLSLLFVRSMLAAPIVNLLNHRSFEDLQLISIRGFPVFYFDICF